MKVLLVNPKFPMTYWGMQHALPLAGFKVNLPPLGLISVAASLPQSWQYRLVDLNAEALHDADIRWSDIVMCGGMLTQAPSIRELITRAHRLDRRIVVGGPAPTTAPEQFEEADILFQGELEGRVEELLDALDDQLADEPRHLAMGERPEMTAAPTPRFDLLTLSYYSSMAVQYSRGCPFSCEFCDIIEIFGRRPRVKSPAQITAELDALNALGYRGSVFFVDDNFIGNKAQVRRLLPEVEKWQKQHGFPFSLYTEASVNLAQDTELVDSMVRSGFHAVFLGIESPSAESLAGANKKQNLRTDLHGAIESLCAAGIEVMGGFIVGFDQDDPEIFQAQWEFISALPIPLAMVGLLMALPGTALSRRLEREGRIRQAADGDNFARPNFVPVMDERTLLEGYAELMNDLYSPESYYDRCLKHVAMVPSVPGQRGASLSDFLTVCNVLWNVGVKSPWRRQFWKLLLFAISRAPHAIPFVFAASIRGEHMIRYTREELLPRMERGLADLLKEERRILKQVTSQPRPAAAAHSARL